MVVQFTPFPAARTFDGEVAEDGAGHVVLASTSGGRMLSLTGRARPGVDHVAIGCADRASLVALHEMLTERAVVPGTITDAPYGSGFVVRDPDGLKLELFAPRSSPPTQVVPRLRSGWRRRDLAAVSTG